jgi:outer membrane receptor protein involved in Fe transport
MNSLRFRHIALCLSLLLLPARMFSQAGVASLSGLVTDPSGAIVVGARVTEANEATQMSRTTITDHSGYYTFVGLPVGHYRVFVNQSGFQGQQVSLILDPSEQGRQDFHLLVAGATSQVSVTAAEPQLSRDDASIGTVIDNQTIVGTPLYQRNWDDLIRLIPGVQMQRFTQQSGSSVSGSTGLFTIHGIGDEQNDYILDGIDNNTFSENLQELSASAARPSVDVISEFKLISNAYTAVYGRSPGAQVDVTTKGGTNQYHGLLFEYLRNRIFDSNDYFTHGAGLPKPQEIQNQFGGNFGGRIIRDKLFGFFDYEGTRIDQGVTRTSTVPLPNERAGDFSPAAAAANGVTYSTLYNPYTGQPFPNNTLTSDVIDPYGQKIINAFPLPNQPGTFNNYVRTGALTDNTDSYDGRVDWNADSNNLVFVRYTQSNRTRDVPGNFGGIADGSSTSSWGNSTLKSWALALGWTRTFGPALTNDFRFGFVRNFSYDQQQPFGMNSPDEFIPGVPDNPATAGGIGITEFVSDNSATIGSPAYLPKQQVPQQFQYTDTISWTRGAHFLRFGADLRAPMRNLYQDEDYMNGGLAFAGIFSAQSASPGLGASYADGLMGLVYQGALSNVYFVDQRLWMLSGFAQDDWKVTRKLTLNLGLRYDFATPPYSAKNQLANFDPSGSGSLVQASSGSLGNRSLVQVNNHDFAPRFGFAYSPDQKTVIRGGYGLYYLLFKRAGSEDQLALNPPYLLETTLNPVNGDEPAFLLKDGFPADILNPADANLATLHIHAMQKDSPTPYSQEWSLGFQRELPGKLVLTTDYVGTKSTHLDIIHDLNQYVPGTKNFPYPNFGYLEYSQANGVGNYSGLEVSAQRRYTNGLSLEAAYTWSKNTGTVYEQDFTNALSSSDVPQRFVLSYLYELPFGHNKPFLSSGVESVVLGGWRTSGIYTYSSGRPFTVTSGGNLSKDIDIYGNATSLPNMMGRPKVVGNVKCWFYYSKNKTCQALSPGTTDAYELPTAANPYGNGSVNNLRGPHTNVFDFALMRDFDLYRRTKMEFRWEVFNLTNSVLFAQPDSTLTDGSVGTITSLAGDPRIMQFALRLSF